MKLVEYRKIAKQVADDVSAALAKHGLKMKPFGARIDERTGVVRMTIECADVNHKGPDGEATTPERELYRTQAHYFGLKAEWLGQSFTMGGKTYVVEGLKARGQKCVLVGFGGKTFLATPEQVERAFLAKTAAQNPTALQNQLGALAAKAGAR